MKKGLLVLLFSVIVLSMVATTIYDIQYTTNAGDGTYPSPMVDQEVTIQGIVTANQFTSGNDKFFVCDLPEEGTGAWHGIYIYEYETLPNMGDLVEITGTVTEYYGLTEIGFATVTVLGSGYEIPAPVSISTDDVNLEMYESVLVTVTNVTVTEGQIDYGQWYVDDGSGECQIDDGFFYLEDLDPPIVIVEDDTWGSITGIVDYSYDEFGLNPRIPSDMVHNVGAQEDVIESKASLLGNYPNPFNPVTNIKFTLDEGSNVTIDIYNIKGEKVKTLVNDIFEADTHSVRWNGDNDNGSHVSSGIYFYKMVSGRFTSTKKMVLLK